jgi:hypothetical protein
MKRDPDPNRLMRFVGRHALNGVIAGWVCMLALLWLDIGGLGALIEQARAKELVTAMMAGAFGVTFGTLGIAWGVLVVLPRDGD